MLLKNFNATLKNKNWKNLPRLFYPILMLYRRRLKFLFRRRSILFLHKNFGSKIITRDDLLINHEKYHVRRFGCEELVTASEPSTLGKTQIEIEKIIYPFKLTFGKPFVCEVPDAELVGPNAIGFNRDGGIVSDTSIALFSQVGNLKKYISIRTLALKKLSRLSPTKLDTACSLVHPWSKIYFHWIADCLTRIEGLEAYQAQTGIKPALIIESNLASWQIDSLKLLGYEPDDCIPWHSSRVQVKKLIVPSFRRHWGDYNTTYKSYGPVVSPLACRWLRQRILSNLPDAESEQLFFSPKIFISRRKAVQRRIINEDKVIEALAPFGFVAYALEELSFSEQVRLFSQANMVVAPHGSGLTNIVFSQNLTVIELFGSYVAGPSLTLFANLSRGLGFRYGCLRGQSPSQDSRQLHADIIVDIAELGNLVTKMQEESSCQ
ncbi:glycosyltransferase family 61 protein [Chroococcidiopsis sp. CCMEE 29]|uniref:glycosyltransferase family 61 protein n=1 Tax=Chroococcidiopsis sp. CCMEE 29 TaxID=155894 RepID=UPI00202147DF|nr:glycosyltransferase family 61 protein [Chroococcidiopsis sp. CCMEE 29]